MSNTGTIIEAPRGGIRRGAGRPPKYGSEAVEGRQVHLPPAFWELVDEQKREKGGSSLSTSDAVAAVIDSPSLCAAARKVLRRLRNPGPAAPA